MRQLSCSYGKSDDTILHPNTTRACVSDSPGTGNPHFCTELEPALFQSKQHAYCSQPARVHTPVGESMFPSGMESNVQITFIPPLPVWNRVPVLRNTYFVSWFVDHHSYLMVNFWCQVLDLSCFLSEDNKAGSGARGPCVQSIDCQSVAVNAFQPAWHDSPATRIRGHMYEEQMELKADSL